MIKVNDWITFLIVEMKLKRTLKSFRNYQQWILIYKNGDLCIGHMNEYFNGKFASREAYQGVFPSFLSLMGRILIKHFI